MMLGLDCGGYILFFRVGRIVALHVLKIFDTGKKNLSIRMKRFSISTNPEKHLEAVLRM